MMPPRIDLSAVQKLKQTLLRDPKQTSVLGGLALVMLFLWGRMLLSGPASATASLIRRSVAAITDASLPVMHAPVTNPVLDWLGTPKRIVQRNLFAINLDYFARGGSRAASMSNLDDPSVTTDDQADLTRQKEILLENLQMQAAKIKLQTTVMGNTPRAMVNGQLVKEGDIVDGFTVVKIDPRKILVQQDGIVLEVLMP